MDFPLPGSSLNNSITASWTHPQPQASSSSSQIKRPISRNRGKISLNSVNGSSGSGNTGNGASSPLRKGLSRGGSPAPGAGDETNSVIVIDGADGIGANGTQSAEVVAGPSTGTKRPLSASTSSNPATTQPSTKRTRSSRPATSGASTSTSNIGSGSRESLLAKYPPPPDARLSHLGGLQPQITLLLETVALPLLHPEIYTHTSIPPPRGVLLHGPPGGGKTRLITCLAGELGLPFISISAPSLVSSLSGDTEKQLRTFFEEARTLGRCLIFLDEVDAITGKRENAGREMEKRIVGQLLTCMDGLADNPEPVIVLAATNRPDGIDPALRRAGRFDHEIEMGVPSLEGREEILRVLTANLKLSPAIDLHSLAFATPGYVGADLVALTGAAGVVAVKRMFAELGVNQIADGSQQHIDELQGGDRVGEVREGMEDMMVVDGEEVMNGGADEEMEGEQTPLADLPPTESSPAAKSYGLLANLHPSVLSTPIATFLQNNPSALPSSQLSHLSLLPSDFTSALKLVQPSAKREGFATVPDVTWADIGALHTIRDELHMAIVQPIRRPEFFKMVGITAPSGVLLWGPPGCGKTLLAKAVANESRANFISVKGPELLNKYVGESERAVRQVFARARASSPCVIFFDELDALVPRRDDNMSEASARVVNTLLTELDGLDARKAVYVVGATNRPEMIDPAMVRPGRLDKLLYVDLPTPQERIEILKTHLAKTPLDESAWEQIVEIVKSDRCDGFSGADLAALVREAATLALRGALEAAGAFENDDDTVDPHTKRVEGQEQFHPVIKVGLEHFETAARKTMPSVSREQKRKYQALRNKFAGLPAKGSKKWEEGKILEETPGAGEAREGAGAEKGEGEGAMAA